MKQTKLISDLKSMIQNHINDVQKFKSFSNEQLNYKSTPEKWSILECLEHLNLYGDFYLVEIEKRILAAKKIQGIKKDFKSGWLGNYFATSMLPSEDGSKMKTMKTFKDKYPKSSDLPRTTIDRFLKQQQMMLGLLDLAEEIDINQVKTNITILKGIIRLKLGDTFRFVIYHNHRHIIQAQNIELTQTIPVSIS